jgi:GNAT superfamily N-acetyltransferase
LAQRPSILQLEQAFVSAWPAVETASDGGWLWRFANGYTKRANSAQSMDPSDEADAASRLKRFAKWAGGHKVPPTFRVTPLAGQGVHGALDGLNWRAFEESVVMAMPVGAAFTPKHHFALLDPTDAAWFEVQARMSGYGPETIIALRDVLDRIKSPAKGVLAFDADGEVAAAALTNNNAGIGVYLNVVVREDARGQGYGRSVMQVALNWSKVAGADWAAIQVLAANTPAVNLYRSLGFEEVYRYHYRRPEQAA